MAEGWLRHYGYDGLEVFSAGTHPEGINPIAVEVMAEVGIDISNHSSNHIDEYLTADLDHVISVCANAERNCPVFPEEVNRIHQPFDDPAKAIGTSTEVIAVYRAVRDQIREFSEGFLNKP